MMLRFYIQAFISHIKIRKKICIKYPHCNQSKSFIGTNIYSFVSFLVYQAMEDSALLEQENKAVLLSHTLVDMALDKKVLNELYFPQNNVSSPRTVHFLKIFFPRARLR